MSSKTMYSDEEIEIQYNARAARPDYDSVVVPTWIARSEKTRSCLKSRLDIAYGNGPKQKCDIFYAAADDAPTLLYFHGGYWQRGDKSIYSFLAEPFVAHNVNVIIVGYDLCPDVSITTISRQAREAIAWMWHNQKELKINASKLTVMGHSAGGHITGMLMGTDWSKFDPSLPIDLVKAGIPVSPLNELDPLRRTTINNGVRMDATEAETESPINHPPMTNAPQLVVCGEKESAEFHRQSDIYVAAFITESREMERYSVPDCDHFDELNVLSDSASPFFRKVLALIRKAEASPPSESVTLELMDAILSAFNSHNADAVASFFAPNGVMLAPAGPEQVGRTLTGPDAIRAALQKRFADSPDIEWTEAKTWVTGDKALSEWRVRGTAPDGSIIDTLGCDLWEFEAGKIVKKDTYYKQKTA